MDHLLEKLNVKLLRIVTEQQYNRSFLFDDLKMLNHISKGLKSYFNQTQKDEASNALVFANSEKQLVSVIRADVTSIDYHNPDSYTDFDLVSSKVMDEVSKNLDVEEYTRLGMRMFFGMPISSPDEGREILTLKFLNCFQHVLNVDSVFLNPTISFTFQRTEKYFVNVSIRVETNATFEFSVAGLNHSQGFFLVIDLDVYTNVNESYGSFISNANEIGASTLTQILKTLEV